MCGLAGMVRTRGPVDVGFLLRANEALYHRGPDQGDTYRAEDGQLAVGFSTRRLAILDLSPKGNQPMQTADGSACIAYNGEVYNEPELRRELEARGHTYRSTSDTESVLYAYQTWGLRAFERLNGMFALALYDRRREQVVLARDRMGIKPLYYAWDGERLVFSSELRTLVNEGMVERTLDPEALDLYLTLGYVPSPYALIKGVRKLPPGSYLVLDTRGQLTVREYWSLAYPPASTADRAEAQTLVRETLSDAIRRQMRSDVPVGVLLSGGVDSSIVAAVAARQTDQPLNTFSITFHTDQGGIAPVYNADAGFARRVAAEIGATHREVVLDDRHDMPTLLRQLVVGLDEPLWEHSFVSIYLMSRLARQHGVKVLLTGDGGDELFAGYPWIAAAWRQEQFERLPILRSTANFVRRFAPQDTLLYLHAENLGGSVGRSDVGRYEHLHRVFNHRERAALTGSLERVSGDRLRSVVAPILRRAARPGRADRLALIDLALWVREHFNQRVDRMTMLNSVEARVPFQDNAVVDLGLALPFTTKARNGRPKHLLKAAFRGIVPDYVLDRPKRPFATPMDDWETGPLSRFLADLLAPERVRAAGAIDPDALSGVLRWRDPRRRDRSSQKLWTLATLQLWAEELNVRRSPFAAAPDALVAD